MKVKFLGKTDFLVLTHNKIYDVLSIEKNWYRLVDDSGDDYLYPPQQFEIVEGGPEDLPEDKKENWWHNSHNGKRPGEEGYEPYPSGVKIDDDTW